MAQKAEYIWMDGAEGQESKASPLTLGWNTYALLLPMLCTSVIANAEQLAYMYRD